MEWSEPGGPFRVLTILTGLKSLTFDSPGPTANTTLQGLPPACRIPGVVPKRVS
jgi:hypothetical protein